MITLTGLIRTLATTKGAHNVLTMKFSNKRKAVTFQNGSTFHLTWSEFRILRDNYKLMEKYVFTQSEDNLFEMRGEDFALAGSLFALVTFEEINEGMYNYDFTDKVVLDVGGFQGESAVFFSKMGAKKVIIYEPVIAHHKLIKKNITLNHIDSEIHDEGIGNRNGTQTIRYEKIDTTLGLFDNGQYKIEIKIKDVANVIEESGADMAKFDCEGAEKSLIHVPSAILRRIELYIIETHSPEIRRAIIDKFEASNFSIEKETQMGTQLSVIFFKRNCSPEIAKGNVGEELQLEVAVPECQLIHA